MAGFANPSSPNLADFILFVTQSMAVPATALPANVTPPPAPSLTAGITGGSLPTGTVYIVLTYLTAYGETVASAEANVAVTGPTGQVVVTYPVMQGGITGYNVYAADATGAEALQNTTPIAIGTNYTLNSLTTGTAAPPTTTTANSPWPEWVLLQAIERTIQVCTVPGPTYTLAVYNCAGHLLLLETPDIAGSTFFAAARGKGDGGYGLLLQVPGVISSSSDQGSSNSFAVPDGLAQLTLDDLQFMRTPWGRAYISFNMCFGTIFGLS